MFYVEEPKNKFSHIVFFLSDVYARKGRLIKSWLEDNISKPDWELRPCYMDTSTGHRISYTEYDKEGCKEGCPYGYGYQYAFKTKEEAMLFKLTWS